MRALRIIRDSTSFYHCVSRVVDRRMIFEAQDKEIFRRIMRNLEAFMGVEVVTYCLMTNHFHILVEVPGRTELKPLTEKELLELLPLLYDSGVVEEVRQEMERARRAKDAGWSAAILERYERRRGSLSCFMRELKQRVTLYMNKKLEREGTLWEGRFKSVLVEGNENALLTMAAYIDLNPVRAGIVTHPEDYRWSGYAEALSGSRGAKRARRGLGKVLTEALHESGFRADWRRTQSRYREFLYLEGEERSDDPQTDEGGRRGFSEAQVEAVLKSGGEFTVAEALRCRVRYFCDGAILGTAEFVDGVFLGEKELGRMSAKRKTGARKMRGANWKELRTLRDLRKDPIKPPGWNGEEWTVEGPFSSKSREDTANLPPAG